MTVVVILTSCLLRWVEFEFVVRAAFGILKKFGSGSFSNTAALINYDSNRGSKQSEKNT